MNLSKFLIFVTLLCSITKGNSQTYIHIFTDRDNIYKLGRIYDVTPLQIAKVNELDSVNQKLLPYQKLIIPDKEYKTDKRGGRVIKTIKHKIIKAESLYSIARHYGVSVYDILLLNPSIERGKPLTQGDELKLQVPANNQSQYSKQIIYLNGDLLKYEEIVVKDSVLFKAALKLNEKFDERLHAVPEVIAETETLEEDIMFDTFFIPKHDTTIMSKMIFNCITFGADSTIDKQVWLDIMYEQVLYVNSELRPKKITSDHLFLIQAFNRLQKLNKEHPGNDFLFGIRGLLYYWLGNNHKALIFSDEALTYNPTNEAALLVRAAIGEEDVHFDYAFNIFKTIHNNRPERNFTLYNIATLYYINNDFPNAIDYYKKLLDRSKELAPELNYRIGHSYIILANDDEGCEFLKESERLGFLKGAAMRTRSCK
jgi:tetratricopeptide (TPR) repeat protein